MPEIIEKVLMDDYFFLEKRCVGKQMLFIIMYGSNVSYFSSMIIFIFERRKSFGG
jgi:hypothetical protein